MAIIITLLKKGIQLKESLEQEYSRSMELQHQQLKALLITASETEFGKAHNCPKILNGFLYVKIEFYGGYKAQVPIYDYDRMPPNTDLEFKIINFSGDLSGITGRLPIGFQSFYRSGKKISLSKKRGDKVYQIVEKASIHREFLIQKAMKL